MSNFFSSIKKFFTVEELEFFDIDGAIESLNSDLTKSKVDFITKEEVLQEQINQQNEFLKGENDLDFAIENIRLITDRLNAFRIDQRLKISEIETQIEELEKGRKHAQLGDVREWHDGEYIKTTRGWIRIKNQSKKKEAPKKDKETSDKKKTAPKKVHDYAKKTPTEKLRAYANNPKKPAKLREIASKELKNREKDNENSKKTVEKSDNFQKISDEYFKKALIDYSDVIVFNEDYKILLLLRGDGEDKFKRKFCLPGGKVESGEGYMTAAIRELKEETNIDAAVEFIDVYKNKDGSTSHYFLTNCEGVNIVLDSEEHINYCWCSLEDIDKYDLIFDLGDRIKSLLGVNQTC